jgi:GrpB-like predicted nucleotidyltransferase (UPF0157 family)
MLGLHRHTVEIVDHDPGWAMLAAEACQAVRNACGQLVIDIQHVGSTAVPGLPAKPILDLAVAVATLASMPEVIGRLTRISYVYRGDYGDAGGHLFVAESFPDVRTIHMHVVEYRSDQWRDYLLFRDLLRNNPALREEYAQLKKHLMRVYRNDRESYTASKEDFIRAILNNGGEPGG